MIDKATIFEIHRLENLGWSQRAIARQLQIDRLTVKKYLQDPHRKYKNRTAKASMLTPYLDQIEHWLDQEPGVKATVVLQRLQQRGFSGKISIVRQLLYKLRGSRIKRTAYMRFESEPGEQMQIDWGHFGSIAYGNTMRKLYALAVLEAHSRMLYVEFTHSQKQACLHQCLLNAFLYFGGTPEKIVVDNMLTAVTERQGAIVRFNDAFLDFLRVFKITPIACNPGAPYEKGKVEAAIKYIRQNFWPLRSFADLSDVQYQVRQWLDAVANVRIHHSTGQRPCERFEPVALNRLPELLPDCRQTLHLKVHKDFAVRFDGNSYTSAPWTVGKTLTLKADTHIVTLYYQTKQIAVHQRCYQRHCRIEHDAHRRQVKQLKQRWWYDQNIAAFASLGEDARVYLQDMINAKVPIKKNILHILALKNQYGPQAVITAIQKALAFNAYGSDYIKNILYQQMTPNKRHEPVKLEKADLNRIVLTQPCLADYDAYVLKERKDDDGTHR